MVYQEQKSMINCLLHPVEPLGSLLAFYGPMNLALVVSPVRPIFPKSCFARFCSQLWQLQSFFPLLPEPIYVYCCFTCSLFCFFCSFFTALLFYFCTLHTKAYLRLYICWLDRSRVPRKYKNPMQGTKCFIRREGHFETSLRYNARLQPSQA